MAATTLHILGISGSLRANSTNTALLRAAQELLPEGVTMTLFPLHDIPLYNGDLDATKSPPVCALKEAIEKADGILIATPEYNYSIPGVLKNALDWASRPAYNSVLAHKPVGVFGASPGALGTARAQDHLRHVLHALLSYAFPHPGILVGHSAQKFDETLKLTDEPTRDRLRSYLQDFSAWMQKHPKKPSL